MKTDKEMILELKESVFEYDSKRKKKTRISLSLVCAVMILMSMTLFANAEKIRHAIFSEEWLNDLKTASYNATGEELEKRFKQDMLNSGDPFSTNSLNDDAGAYILLDDRKEIKMDMTVENGGYTFYFDKITSGKELSKDVVSGSIMHGDAEMEWQVHNNYYAIFEISRTDGKPMTEKDYEYSPMWKMYAEGYRPWLFTMTMEGNSCVEYDDEYKFHYAVNVSDFMAFAGKKMTIAAIDLDMQDPFLLELDENGEVKVADKVTSPYGKFDFVLDKKFGDKKAVKEYVETYEGVELD